MIRKIHIWILVLFSLSPAALAQEKQVNPKPDGTLINDVEAIAVARHPVSKYLDAASVAVADIDLTRVDAAESLGWLNQQFGIGDGAPVDSATSTIHALKTAGASHIYVCASLSSIQDRSPLIAIPCENTSAAKAAVSDFLQTANLDKLLKVAVDDRVVLVGARAAIDGKSGNHSSRLQQKRPDLILSMQQQRRSDHRIVMSLPVETRRELNAFWPDRLPQNAIVQFSPKQLVADIKRVEISFSIPPKIELFAGIDATDNKAAGRVRRIIEEFLRLAPETRDAVDLSTENARVSVKFDAAKTVTLLKKVIARDRRRAEQIGSMDAGKQIGLAIHNHHGSYSYLPPRCLTDREGNPLLSWRVTLLPYIEQNSLYNEFELGEAWDSDANAILSETVIPTLSSGIDLSKQAGMTRFRAPVFPGSLWHGDGPPKKFRDVIDGTSNTIAIIYAPPSEAVAWSSPEPWVISENDPVGDVFDDQDNVVVVLLDGAARVLRRDEVDNEKLKALLTIAGKEKVEW